MRGRFLRVSQVQVLYCHCVHNEIPLVILHDQVGSLSSGLSHKTKCVAWQCIAQAVNEVGGAAQVPKRRKKMV